MGGGVCCYCCVIFVCVFLRFFFFFWGGWGGGGWGAGSKQTPRVYGSDVMTDLNNYYAIAAMVRTVSWQGRKYRVDQLESEESAMSMDAYTCVRLCVYLLQCK